MIVPLVLALLTQGLDRGMPMRVDGRVVRGTRAGEVPMAQHWVVLHRLGSDRSGPVDSVRTNADGRYTFRFTTSGDTAAIYFATTSHGGIVYPTPPFRTLATAGDAANLTVFDTTSGPVPLKRGGRHLIIGAPQSNGRRPVGEVYDLENDSTVTVVARDSVTPIYRVRLPNDVSNFRVNGAGEFGASALDRRGSEVGLYAPVSPGIRQFAFTYELPAKAFPLAIPADVETGVLEILIEEPAADVRAPAVREVEPTSMEGRTFRRFLANEVPANAVVHVSVPRVATADRQRIYLVVALVLLAAMGVALVYAARRPRGVRVAPVVIPPAEPRSRELIRAIAELDDAFNGASTLPDARADYDARRASLKAELAEALAAERSRA